MFWVHFPGGNRSGSQSELRYNVDSLDPSLYRGQSATNNAAHSSGVTHSSKAVTDDAHSHQQTAAQTPCKWPGIEAILESYQKHCEGMLKLTKFSNIPNTTCLNEKSNTSISIIFPRTKDGAGYFDRAVPKVTKNQC